MGLEVGQIDAEGSVEAWRNLLEGAQVVVGSVVPQVTAFRNRMAITIIQPCPPSGGPLDDSSPLGGTESGAGCVLNGSPFSSAEAPLFDMLKYCCR